MNKPVTKEAWCACPTCKGRGIIETGEMIDGPGGIGFETVDCTDCDGGAITSDDHDQFDFKFGTDVTINGEQRVVFFDYEGDDIFVWWLPGDKCTDGEHLTKDERDSVYQQLDAWYHDWCSWSEEAGHE